MLKKGITQEAIAELFPQRLIEIARFKGPAWHPGNLCLNSGIQGFEKLIAGLSSPPNAWSNAYAYLGVGDSSQRRQQRHKQILQASTNYTYVGIAASVIRRYKSNVKLASASAHQSQTMLGTNLS